jgi:hypothetical protein
MPPPERAPHPRAVPSTVRSAARAILVFLGLYQGAVPLVVKLAFGRGQRFAPALWLAPPWWWIACIAVAAVAFALAATVDGGRPSRTRDPDPEAPSGAHQDRTAERGSRPAGAYDAASAVVLLAGIYNGVAPFIARLVLDDGLLLALPLRLGAPWWWITSIAVAIATVALLAVIEHAKERSSTGRR